MKYKHIDDLYPLNGFSGESQYSIFEKTVVVDRMSEMGEHIDLPNANSETALMMPIKRNNRKMIEYHFPSGNLL